MTTLSSRQRAPLRIENIQQTETAENFVEQHFRRGPLHRAKDTSEYDVEALLKEHGDSLVRSSQELGPVQDSKELMMKWVMLVFQRPNDTFWHFVSKANSYGPADECELNLTVTSRDPRHAAAEVLMLRERYQPNRTGPGFFLVKDVRKPKRMPLREDYLLNRTQLELHYGPNFPEWVQRFSAGLSQNGLSILRGKPGTGKTSFLRHLICSLKDSHCFYYLPVDAFGLLQGGLTEFLARERQKYRDRVLVLVLEDAEQLLLDRRGVRDGLASTLLNFTDGFIGDLITTHLICTVNSEAKDLDEAVLRPGRQKFFHEFDLLSWEAAQALAKSMNVELTQRKSYSLAEIFHHKDTQDPSRLTNGSDRVIGFQV